MHVPSLVVELLAKTSRTKSLSSDSDRSFVSASMSSRYTASLTASCIKAILDREDQRENLLIRSYIVRQFLKFYNRKFEISWRRKIFFLNSTCPHLSSPSLHIGSRHSASTPIIAPFCQPDSENDIPDMACISQS